MEGLYYLRNENNDTDQLCSSAQLICSFVSAYAKCSFSYDVALKSVYYIQERFLP